MIRSRSCITYAFLLCKALVVYTTRELYSNTWLVEMKIDLSESESSLLAESLGFTNKGKIFTDDKKYEFKNNNLPTRFNFPAIQEQQILLSSPLVQNAEQQILHKVVYENDQPDMEFVDPNYDEAWHLLEDPSNGESQTTMNIQEAWRRGYTGKGVVVAVVDTGVEKTHPDLRENYDRLASRDVERQDDDQDPKGKSHGTNCAGIIAASANNSFCTVGVAYKARLGGIRLSGDNHFTSIVVARAWSFNPEYIDIYSNSWSFSEKNYYRPHSLEMQATSEGILKGRGGKGSIYLISGGNYDTWIYNYANSRAGATEGHKNMIETMVINAVSSRNKRTTYARECACVIVSAYSGSRDTNKAITTTSLGGTCTDDFSGTSAATPIAAGVIALLLEANSNLTWRDVQHITVLSANSSITYDEAYITNRAGLKFSTWIGFGLMDALSMVKLGEQWVNVPQMRWVHSDQKYINRHMDRSIFEDSIALGPKSSSECKRKSYRTPCYIEAVILTVNFETESRKYLQIELTSPSNTTITVLPATNRDDPVDQSNGIHDWHFKVLTFWGETLWGETNGTWRVSVKLTSTLYEVEFESYSLLIFGTHEHPYGGRTIAELKNSVAATPTHSQPDMKTNRSGTDHNETNIIGTHNANNTNITSSLSRHKRSVVKLDDECSLIKGDQNKGLMLLYAITAIGIIIMITELLTAVKAKNARLRMGQLNSHLQHNA